MNEKVAKMSTSECGGEEVRVSCLEGVHENGNVIINLVLPSREANHSVQSCTIESRMEPDLENRNVPTLDLIKDSQKKPNGQSTRSIGVGTCGDDLETSSSSTLGGKVVDEDTIIRRRSLVPMSSMEEENLRERLRLAHLKLASEIVNKEQKYTREGFRKLLQSKVRQIKMKFYMKPIYFHFLNFKILTPNVRGNKKCF